MILFYSFIWVLILLQWSEFTISFQPKSIGWCNRRNHLPKSILRYYASVERIQDLQYPLGKVAFSLLPFSPESNGRRKTILSTIVADKIWTVDQLQGVLHVNVPVRSQIVALKSGGLLINNPVAPTKECISLLIRRRMAT